MPTPINENPHTWTLTVEVNVYNAASDSDARDAIEAAIERIDHTKDDLGHIVEFNIPRFS